MSPFQVIPWRPPTHAGEVRCHRLTEMQRNVLDSLVEGKTTQQVARDWGISTDTVKTHVRRMFAATGAHDRVHLLAMLLTGELVLEYHRPITTGAARRGATLSPAPTYCAAL